MQAQLAQERHRANHRSYGDLAAIGVRRTSLSGHYAIEVAASAVDGYELVATATGRQAHDTTCRTLRLVVAGGSVVYASGPDAAASNADRGQPQVLEPVMRTRRSSRGLSIVELLVGTAVGLVIVAAGTTVVTRHARENRALTIETRLMQDLRTAADIVARDLRRAGYWGASASGVRSDDGSAVLANPYALVTPGGRGVRRGAAQLLARRRARTAASTATSASAFACATARSSCSSATATGRRSPIRRRSPSPPSRSSRAPRRRASSASAPSPAPPAARTCPPRQQVRSFAVAIEAQAVADPGVRRSVRAGARLRNGSVVGSCEA